MVATLASTLHQAGHPVLVVVPAKGEGWLAEQLQQTPVTIEHFRLPRPVSVSAARQIVGMIRDFGARVVHAHEFSMAVYGSLAALRSHVPHVITMHGGLYYAQRLRRRVAMRWAARGGALVAVSGTLADHLSTNLRIPRAHIQVIANGVPLMTGRPGRLRAELALPESAPLIVAVGNLYPVKGHTVLIEAMAQLRTRPTPVHLAIAGRGDALTALQTQAAAAGLSDRIHFLGLRNDVPDLLASADLFVHPSLSEGLPIAVLEAMGAGLPVIATAVGDVPTVLSGGNVGVIVPPGNYGALAGEIDRVLDEPEDAKLMGKRAQVRARTHYSVAGMISTYRALYARHANSASPSHRA